jgi:hypothetical protein
MFFGWSKTEMKIENEMKEEEESAVRVCECTVVGILIRLLSALS